MAEPSRSPTETPASAWAATVIATSPPPAAATAGPSSQAGRLGSRPPKTSRPVAAAPTSRPSPQYQAQRPATASGAGPSPSRTSAAGRRGAEAAPTPNANTPSVRWPSTVETIRQLTV